MAGEAPAMTQQQQPTSRIQVAGMTCQHCVTAIEQAVRDVPGVGSVAVDLAGGSVTITGAADDEAIRAAIAEAGYDVAPAP